MTINQIKNIERIIEQKENKSFIEYFFGKLPVDSNYTILGFQKGLKQKINSNKDIDSHLSVLCAFNHNTCTINRYLVNYGLPQMNEDETEKLITDKVLNINHKQIKDQKRITYQQMNSLNDGKLTKNFMKTFILELVLSKIANGEPDYKYNDMRLIKILLENGLVNKSEITEERRQFFPLSRYNQEIIINIPQKYYSKRIYSQVNLLSVRQTIRCVPYTNEDLGEALTFLKKRINGRLFKNNLLFEDQLSSLNQRLHNKALEIKISSEDADDTM